jgi:predicted Zn-dependent peptidase
LLLPLDSNTAFTADAARVSRSVLRGGVRVLTEEVPGAPSVAIAASLAIGSRDESEGLFGSTHFLEHLLFKGTKRRTSKEISIAFDSVGGSSNAATAKEFTSYYARVQNSALPLALDLILDMFFNARLDEADFELERTVILEELAMNEDDPEDVAHENLAEALLPEHPLGRRIGGTEQTIREVTRDSVFSYYKTHYIPANLVITAAGGVKHEDLLALVEAELDRLGIDGDPAPNPRRAQEPSQVQLSEPKRLIRKPLAQANVLLGFQSIHGAHPERYALGLMNTILGGGMSSRLYQEIREDRGLAYSTYSYQQSYSDAGYFGLYAGTNEENLTLVTQLLRDEINKVAQSGVTQAELELALGSITGGLALKYESSLARMNRLLAAEIGSGEYLSVSDVMTRFHEVSMDQVQAAAQLVLSGAASLVAVGSELAEL